MKRRTIIVEGPLAFRMRRIVAARDGELGMQIMTLPLLAARLAGGFVQPASCPQLLAAIRTALEAAGIKDVEVMSQPEYAGRISVGLFNDDEHAQKRAVAVRAMGYVVEVEPRQRQWNDHYTIASIPNLDALIVAGRGDLFAIRRVRQIVDRSRMAVRGPYLFAGCGLPND